MSPRAWWRTRVGPDPAHPDPAGPDPTRPDPTRPDPTGPDPGRPGTGRSASAPASSGSLPALDTGVLDDPQLARLRDLVGENVTGALHLNGRWRGRVYLLSGEIGHVESVLTPGVEALLMRPLVADEERWAELTAGLRRGDTADVRGAAQAHARKGGRMPDVQVELLRRTAMADAALAVLGTAGPEAARTRFRPGERHWCVPGRTYSLAETLDEVARRRTVLSGLTLGVRVDRPVSRVEVLRHARIRLTAAQWDVVRLADGVRSPLDIAWLLGHGVFATTVAVHQLSRLGVLRVETQGVSGAQPGPAPQGPPAPPRHRISFLRAFVETPRCANTPAARVGRTHRREVSRG